MKYKAVIVLDVLLFESFHNENFIRKLDEYFVVLWTSTFCNKSVSQIPYDGYINGLRNGFKPYRYLRMYLRKYHPDVLCLPIAIVDFERYYSNSRFGYDLCVDFDTLIIQHLYNNRFINVVDTKSLFTRLDMFAQQFRLRPRQNTSEENILYNNVVLTLGDIFDSNSHQSPPPPPHIVNKKCILIVSPSFFEIPYNIHCSRFREFLSTCFLVVWMDNKNIDRMQIANFIKTMQSLHHITINYMLFGLDRNVKSITVVRQRLPSTRLPFILVDNSAVIYDRDDIYFTAVCDFDYYIDLQEYLRYSIFYDMQTIITSIRQFLHAHTLVNTTKSDKFKIVECEETTNRDGSSDDDDDDDDDEYHYYNKNTTTTTGRSVGKNTQNSYSIIQECDSTDDDADETAANRTKKKLKKNPSSVASAAHSNTIINYDRCASGRISGQYPAIRNYDGGGGGNTGTGLDMFKLDAPKLQRKRYKKNKV